MYDTEKPDEILKQIPLIKNPSFQPPRPVLLNSNYDKFLSNAPNFIIPPHPSLTAETIDVAIEQFRNKIQVFESHLNDKRIEQYKNWLNESRNRIAPGFSFDGVMQPQRVQELVQKKCADKTTDPLANDLKNTSLSP